MRVSVIIPAHNAAATLPRTLRALAAQDLAEPFEVVVVDDGSRDRTAPIANDSANVRLVSHPAPRGPGPARNTGVEAATGTLLAFTDADCFPRADWLRRGIEALAGADLVQGAVRADGAVVPMPFDRTVWVVAEVGLYETANLFVRRERFQAVGGFEDWLSARVGKPLAEDVWFGWKLRRAGARTTFCNDAVVEHAVFRRGPAAYIRERVRVTYFPDIVEKMPELRRDFLFARLFLNRRSAAFDLALAGLAAAPLVGSALPLAAALPYARFAARAAVRWRRRAPLVAATDLAADSVGFVALLIGSLRRRCLVL